MAPEFFLNPTHPMQKRYEALRASFVQGLSAQRGGQEVRLLCPHRERLAERFQG
jgi:hypothetical protein